MATRKKKSGIKKRAKVRDLSPKRKVKGGNLEGLSTTIRIADVSPIQTISPDRLGFW